MNTMLLNTPLARCIRATLSCLALSLVVSGNLAAQTVALTNIGSSVSGSTSIGSSPEVRSVVVSFNTGFAADSFDFTGIDFQFRNAFGAPTGLTVELYGPGFNFPTATGDFLTGLALTGGNPAVAGVSSFSGSATLAAGATYHVKLYTNDIAANSGITYNLDAGSSTYTGQTGWSNDDISVYFGSSLVAQSIGFSTLMTVYASPASAIPEPSTYAAMAGLAALGLVVWRRRQQRA